MKLLRIVTISSATLLSACSWNVQMMPRDSGTVYSGVGRGDGAGGGSMSIVIDGRTYSGPVMRVSSNESYGFFQTFGRGGASNFGTATVFGGTINVKAMLSSPDNHGMRCDLTGDGAGHLGGICVDEKSRVYDVLAHR